MGSFEEARVKLTNYQLRKSGLQQKNKIGAILRTTNKNFQDEELPHELFLTTRQKTKIIHAFTDNISIDIKLRKAQLSKIIQ